MVKILLNFIQASRSRNCLLHHKSAEKMLLDFSSMNRMRYRRVGPVFICTIFSIQLLMYGVIYDFSCQKSNTPGTAIGRDQARGQENKIIKI